MRVPFTVPDVAAALLGENLWYPPLQEFRSYLETVEGRPHLWDFTFAESGAWPSQRWRSLSLDTRVARARIGSPAQECEFVFAPAAVGLRENALRGALDELRAVGLCLTVRASVYRLIPIASAKELKVDLHLVEIIAHWLRMLDHADRISRDRAPTGYEVHGYLGACARCKEAWGKRPRSARWIPPFHPGCRCFAQPRFESTPLRA
jgi:hypothetical protein